MTRRDAIAAGAPSRLAALTVDAFFLAGIALLILVSAVQIGIGVTEPITDLRLLGKALAGSTALRLVPLLCVPLLWVFRLGFGATPGQLLCGVRVVDAHGGRPSHARVLARGPALLIALLPLGLGVVWMLRDARRRGLHDRLTGTRVIEEDESRMTLTALDAAL